MNSWTRWKVVGQLWFWSSPSPVWVQYDLCEGEFAAMLLLHLIPGLHYTSAPVKQRTDVGTSPSLQRLEEYCVASCAAEVISLLQPKAPRLNLECCFKGPNIGGWQSWKIICPNKVQSRHQIWVIIASQWISELCLTTFSLVHGEFSIT